VNELPEDFRDLLLLLLEHEAEFVIVGGHAVAFHGHPRATKDLDVLVRTTHDNARRVYAALAAFGAPLDAFEVTEQDFSKYRGVLQIGVPPLRIDILTSISGVSFSEAIQGGDTFELEGHAVPVIGLSALISNKRSANRDQDRADIVALQKHRRDSDSE